MNSSFALKSPISYSFTDATNFKGKGTAGCTSSLAPTTHLLLYILTNCTSIYTIGTESTFVKTSAHIILRVSIGKRILPMKTHSRAICLQPSPANTVKRASVDFTAPVIPSSRSPQDTASRTHMAAQAGGRPCMRVGKGEGAVASAGSSGKGSPSRTQKAPDTNRARQRNTTFSGPPLPHPSPQQRHKDSQASEAGGMPLVPPHSA